MLFNLSDIENEIGELHQKIIERRRQFDEGMRKDLEFGELKKIYSEIKEAEKRLELCFEEVNAQQG